MTSHNTSRCKPCIGTTNLLHLYSFAALFSCSSFLCRNHLYLLNFDLSVSSNLSWPSSQAAVDDCIAAVANDNPVCCTTLLWLCPKLHRSCCLLLRTMHVTTTYECTTSFLAKTCSLCVEVMLLVIHSAAQWNCRMGSWAQPTPPSSHPMDWCHTFPS